MHDLRFNLFKKLQEIKQTFYNLYNEQDRQRAGRELENVLYELFALHDLNPHRSFRVAGEEIDGSFELDNEIYLLEAKWESAKVSERPLLEFRGKIEGKSQFTRGVFLSVNGFTESAKEAIARGKQPCFFLMDGYDLAVVLEGHINLKTLLRNKRRCLAEKGRVYVSAKEFQDQ